MPTIADVRKQYPQYEDLTDDQLADALHKKFYADMPEEAFRQKIGLQPKPKPRPSAPADRAQKPVAREAILRATEGLEPGTQLVATAVRNGLLQAGSNLREGFGDIASDFNAAYGGLNLGMSKAEEDRRMKTDPAFRARQQARVEAAERLSGAGGMLADKLLTGIGQGTFGLDPEDTRALEVAAGYVGGGGAGGNLLKATTREEAGAAALAPRRSTEKARMAAPAAKMVSPEQAAYNARVAFLADRGVELTPGQVRGGMTRRLEEGQKSNPLLGPAIRHAEDDSIRSFNRATYNEVLEPLGQKITKAELPNQSVGREGVAMVEQRLNQAYEQLKPKIRFVPDSQFQSDVAGLQAEASLLPGAQKAQLRQIINERLLKPMRAGSLNGEEFKRVEGDIGHWRGLMQGSPDPMVREAGNMLSELQGHMRSNLERSSAPEVVQALRKTNEAWARFVRLQTAATNRASSGGVFTPADLLTAVRRSDRSVRKGAFARGDALMQDFAESAGQVLPNRLPDSGTAERLMMNGKGLVGAGLGGAVGGLPGAVIGATADMASGAVTNHLAGAMLRKHAERMTRGRLANAPTGQNYLAQVRNRPTNAAPLVPAAATATAMSGPQQ